MLTYNEMLRKWCSGQLSGVCCLTLEQLLELHGWLQGMPPDAVLVLHELACCSKGGGTGPGTPGPGTGPAVPPAAECLAQLSSYLCTPDRQATLRSWQNNIATLALWVPDFALKSTLVAVAGTLAILRDICDTKSFTNESLTTVCETWNSWNKNKAQLLGALPTEALEIAESMIESPMYSTVAQVLDLCCAASVNRRANTLSEARMEYRVAGG